MRDAIYTGLKRAQLHLRQLQLLVQDRLIYRLEYWGVLPSHEPTEPLEDVVQAALHPVGPSANFRESLRSRLATAAESKLTGLVVEYPQPLRQGVIMGLALGLVTASGVFAVLVWRSRRPRR